MENATRLEIENMGYDSFFESGRDRLELGGFQVARVTSVFKEAYKVRCADGEYLARVTGKQMFEAASREDYPAVGDWVAIEVLDGEHAVIRGILPRKSIIKRRFGNKTRSGEKVETQVIAANIDVAFVVESMDRDYNLNRFERYFALVESGGAKPAIILNKTDLISKDELEQRLSELGSRFPNIVAVPTSTALKEGLGDLERNIEKGKTYCFLGSSGVGKSSLINMLIGEDSAKTGETSSYSDRGRHVTTSRQMYFLNNGGIVIDNPGVREVGLADAVQGVDGFFADIAELAERCKFADCTHMHEPGCEVVRAVQSGELDKEMYSNYIDLKKEAEHNEMSDYEKKEKDRKFGKYMKNTKKDLKNLGHKDYQ